MKILGFDASTKTVGFCLLECSDDFKNVKFIYADFYKPPQKGNIFQRLTETKEKIAEILNEHKPDIIAIEEFTLFMPGKSNARTITALAVFNRTVGLVCYDYTGRPPLMQNVMSIRHSLKLNKELPAKESMPELVSKHLGVKFKWMKEKNEIMEENYDKADAMAVALYTSKQIQKMQDDLNQLCEKMLKEENKTKLKKLKKKYINLSKEYYLAVGYDYKRNEKL